MKELFNRIVNGDVPTEWAFGIVAVGGIVALLCWHMLTKDDKTGQTAIRAGFIPVALGIAGIVFFTAFFDVSVSVNGQSLANLDKLSQRQNGIIISAATLICGVVMSSKSALRRK
jgi:hypothetical protein